MERPAISSTRKITRNRKNKVLAMAMDVPAMPVKPNRPAMSPITRKIRAHLSKAHSVFPNATETQHAIGTQRSQGFFVAELVRRCAIAKAIGSARGVVQQLLGGVAR